MSDTKVSISLKEYSDLLRDSDFLNCLRNAGVDNWEGYDFAIEEYQQTNSEEDEENE